MQEIYWHLTFMGIYYKYSKGTLAKKGDWEYGKTIYGLSRKIRTKQRRGR